MGRLIDDLDKVEDKFYYSHLSNSSESAPISDTVFEYRKLPSLPSILLKAFPGVNLDHLKDSSTSPISEEISMVVHGIRSSSAGLHAWSAGVFYKEHGLIISSAGRNPYTLKELQVLAFSAGLLSLKRPCQIYLIAKVLLFGTRKIGTRLTAIDSSIHQTICSWSRINHISKVETPWNSYQQRAYEISAHKTDAMLRQYQEEAPAEVMVALERRTITS